MWRIIARKDEKKDETYWGRSRFVLIAVAKIYYWRMDTAYWSFYYSRFAKKHPEWREKNG